MAAGARGGGGLSRDPSEGERARLGRIFGGYAASTRKRGAWRADNPGNVAIRRELTDAVFELAGDAIAGGGPILDVGCGNGWWLAELAERGVAPGRLRGVELLEARAAAAAERVP
ncbi:MAG: hypothetical protein JWN32_3424, partial [Solirubrobacterales bacterium]|nr:hypothetical protein [Solirubrobacterales bacterium]